MDLRLHWIDGTIIIGYLLALSAVGFYFARRQKSLNDFFRAGQGMGWLPVGLSLMAALNSGLDYLTGPSAAIRYGVVIALNSVSWIFLYPYLVKVTLPFYRRLDLYSVYEYLERRFDVRARTLAVAIFLLWRLGWMATAMYVPCLALNAATGGAIPLVPTIIILGAVVTFYTMLGGIEAVVWTDVIQFCIMFGGLAATVLVVVNSVPGGFTEIWQTAQEAGKLTLSPSIPGGAQPELLEKVRLFFLEEVTVSGIIISSILGRITVYTSDQIMIQRLQTARSLRDSKRAFVINAVTDTVWMSVLVFVGLALFAYFQHHDLPEQFGSDRIFPYFVAQTFPVGLAGLVIAAIFAASLSSIDSAINSCTSVVVVDVYNRLFLKQQIAERHLTPEQQREQIRVSRMTTLVVGILAVVVASNVGRLGNLFEIGNRLIQTFTGPMFGIFVLGMFTRRARSLGVVVGGVVGMIAACYVAFLSTLSFLWPSTFGLVATVSIGYVVSCVMPSTGSEGQGLTWKDVMREPLREELPA